MSSQEVRYNSSQDSLALADSPQPGNVDPIDSAASTWASLFPSSADEPRMQTMKLCAVRETFEECGILLAEEDGQSGGKGREKWAALGDGERKAWRDKVGSLRRKDEK